MPDAVHRHAARVTTGYGETLRMSEDPFGLSGGLNLYGYVNDDPINFIDSDGRYAIAALGAGIVLAAGYLTYLALQNHANNNAHPHAGPGFPHMPYNPTMPPGGPTTAPPWDPPAPPVPGSGPLDNAGDDPRSRSSCTPTGSFASQVDSTSPFS